MNHHSSEEMNFTVALRQAWFGPLTKVPFFALMPLIGFDPIITAIVGAVSTLYGLLTHTKWVNKLGILEYIFITPCLLYTSPSPRDKRQSRMPSSA